MAKRTTLYHPDGRKYETGDQAEVVQLKALGYTDRPPKKAEPVAPKSTDSK